jgi:hypothetical protein
MGGGGGVLNYMIRSKNFAPTLEYPYDTSPFSIMNTYPLVFMNNNKNALFFCQAGLSYSLMKR